VAALARWPPTLFNALKVGLGRHLVSKDTSGGARGPK
jgi:hypothetical protein